MLFPKRNQKQIAERLRGNLDYYNHRQPWRTLRWWVSALSLVAGIAAVPAFYYLRGPESVMNPGPISRGHAAIANNCAACHPQTTMIRNDSRQAGRIVRAEYFVPIDQACGQCHFKYDLHQRNVAPDPTRPAGTGARNETSSCTACHREHVTSGKMLPTTDQNCAACHDRQDLMNASSEIGRKVFPPPAPESTTRRIGELTVFTKSRPPEGYPTPFAAFDKGHPGFQIHTRHLKDIDTLRFGHALHERVAFKTGEGTVVTCEYCHKPDAARSNFQKITFENACMSCHALRFDPSITPNPATGNPGLVVPHGDTEAALKFLTGVDKEYYSYYLKTSQGRDAGGGKFVADRMANLATLYGARDYSGLKTALINRVFLYKKGPAAVPGAILSPTNDDGSQGPDVSNFPSCRYCHPVDGRNRRPDTAPVVTAPVIVDRWLSDGRFDHSQHVPKPDPGKPGKTFDAAKSCDQCHASIHTSAETADINIPTQLSCTKCHNSVPGVGVANECQSCHGYHNDPGRGTVNRTDFAPPTAIDPKRLAGLPPGHGTTLREMLRVKADGVR